MFAQTTIKNKIIVAAVMVLCVIVVILYVFIRHGSEVLPVHIEESYTYIEDPDEYEPSIYEAETPIDREARAFVPTYIEHNLIMPLELSMEVPKSINSGYSWIIPPIFDIAGQFSGGLAAVRQGGKWGAINTYGDIVIPIIFEVLVLHNVIYYTDGAWYDTRCYVDLSSSFFSARLNGKWGVIDTAGRVIVPFEFDRTLINSEHGVVTVAVRVSMNVWHAGLFDLATGRELVPIGMYNDIFRIRDGFADVICDDGLVRREGVININTGHEVVPLTYGGAFHLSEGFSAVNRTFGWGLVNAYGERVTPFIYDYIWNFFDDVVMVRRLGLWGAIDFEGNYVVTPKYNAINRVSDMPEGLVFVYIGDPLRWDGLWGILDVNSNELVVPVQHRDLWIIGENLAIATADSWGSRVLGEPTSYTLIDITDGREIATGTLDFHDGIVQGFYGNFAIFTIGEGSGGYWRFGLIDRMGKEILPPIYYMLLHFSDNLLVINDSIPADRFCNRQQGRLVDTATWEEILPWHDFIGTPTNGLALINTGGEWVSFDDRADEIINGYWGFIDAAGQIVIPPILAFEHVQTVSEGIAAVQRDGKCGFIRIY